MQSSRIQPTGCRPGYKFAPKPAVLATCADRFARPGASRPAPGSAQAQPRQALQAQSGCPQAAKPKLDSVTSSWRPSLTTMYKGALNAITACSSTAFRLVSGTIRLRQGTFRPNVVCQASTESAASSDSGLPVGDSEGTGQRQVDQPTPGANEQGGELATLSTEIGALKAEIDLVKGTAPRDSVLYAALLNRLTFLETKENQLREAAKGPEELQAAKRKIVELEALLKLPAWQRLAMRHTRPAGAGGVTLAADEVMDIVASGESSLAEFKQVSLTKTNEFALSTNDIAKQGCAFANSSQGGTLLYGIQDSPRGVVGVDPAYLDRFVSHVSNALKSSASPPIVFSISTVEVASSEGKPVRVVAVDIPPARDLTSAGQPRTVYQRVGDTTRKVEGVALAELRQHWHAMRARVDAGDVFPVEDAYISRFMDVLKLKNLGIDPPADKVELQQRLCMMQLAKDTGGPEPVLTVAGLLLLGPSSDWQEDLPQCSGFLIKILVCNDDDPPGTPVSECTTRAPREYLIMGDALHQINQAVTFIDSLTALEYEIRDTADFLGVAGAPRGIQRRQYPLVAIRELIVNAIVHRSYFMARGGQVTIKVRHRSLEITSPGALSPGLTPQALGNESAFSSPRNIVLSWYMHRLTVRGGRVFEGHGQGIARARRLIHSYGGSLTFKELPAGAVVAMVTAGKSPLPSREVQ